MRCHGCHTCKACNTEKGIKAFEGPASVCQACNKLSQSFTCDACKEKTIATAFDKLLLGNAQKYARCLVCLSCAEKGVSPKDTKMYPCAGCGNRGHLKFSKFTLCKYKKGEHRNTFACLECIQRLQGIDAKLRLPLAWKCTCPGKATEKTHRWSNEKCQLYPQRAGEKRWAGKNTKVTEEDLQFKERMNKRPPR